ncbi:MAG: nucleotide sugar dehydrogenase [Deltaproteobacteria bacterium]|nr:nucleotide sugar dehydrogenase [Deltaproteobacteria bacterium]MBW2694562.1 nucleotide sugar dehydrogenase [Deltaproteobacteria bacterium]
MTRLQELSGKIDARDVRVGVIGLGYVGLPLAVGFAKAGVQVIGFDLDGEKVRSIQDGVSHIEDVSSEDLAAVRAGGKLSATIDFDQLIDCDIINVCVPTPLTKTRDPDVSYIVRAVEDICKSLRPGQLIILGSTTYPGTTHDLYVPMLEAGGLKIGEDFAVAFAPERIDPANTEFAVHDVPKVVGGETPLCTQLAAQIFRLVFDEIVPVTSTQSAEMVKLLENTFRAINIGLANEVALMCGRLGLDVWEVIDAAATKPYGFMKFLPGPGLGGHCIPVDPAYLAWKMRSLNFQARFIDLATEINGQMPSHVADRINDLLNEDRIAVNGAKILILGAAYKSNVSDLRESPALDVMRLLVQKGADLCYSDPHVQEVELDGHTFKSVELTDDLLGELDLAVIITQHAAVDYDHVVARCNRVFDTRNATRDVASGREKITKL